MRLWAARSWRRAFMVTSLMAALTAPQAASGQGPLAPPPVKASSLTLSIEPAGRMPAATNAASPVAAAGALLLIDQTGSVYRWDGAQPHALLSPQTMPAGIKPVGREAVLNVAASDSGNVVFVVFTSSTVPRGVPMRRSPRPGADAWQVFYRYDFDGTALSNPKPVVALQVRTDGHSGGGLAMLADGSVLFASGDNGDAGEDGRAFAQDASVHLGKILRINPGDGSVTVVAAGVRNVQRLSVGAREGEAWVDFIDMGGSVAEEFNSIRVNDLLRTGPVRNFGWGRNTVDGQAREGWFYINAEGIAQSAVATEEPGFISPIAQFGREGTRSFGASGPVSSASFQRISALFGDLPGGAVFAVTGSRADRRQDVFRVGLVDRDSKPVTLLQLAHGQRPDPRFFNFPDGSAGVLLEQTGEFFRLKELAGEPAAPASPRDGFFDSGGVRIHYVDQGTGPAVILVHELDAGVRSWIASGVFQNLARDYRVVALDARGHGLSGKPHEPAQYGSEMARDVSRLMDHLSIPRAHLVGCSMGAELVALMLVAEPGRALTATLVSGGGRFRWLPTDDQHMEEEALEYLKFGVSATLFLEQSPPGTPEPADGELRALAATALADPGRDVQALAAFSRARRARLITPEQAAAVRVPTLGIALRTDPEGDSLRALTVLRPDVKLTIIDNAARSDAGGVLGRSDFLAALRTFLAANR